MSQRHLNFEDAEMQHRPVGAVLISVSDTKTRSVSVISHQSATTSGNSRVNDADCIRLLHTAAGWAVETEMVRLCLLAPMADL